MRTGKRQQSQRSPFGPRDNGASATDYYATHYHTYHAETFSIDPAPFLGPFARRLSPGSRVLDVGCGSGRDLVWLKGQGFEVLGFERSPGLAELARRQAGCEVIVGDFTVFDFTALEVDALLMSGALVHVPHADLPAVLSRLLPAIKPRGRPSTEGAGRTPGNAGRVYISLKEGRGRHTDERGRVFYLWQDDALRRLFAGFGLPVAHFRRGASAVGGGSIWLGYVLQKGNWQCQVRDGRAAEVRCLTSPCQRL